MLGFRRDLSFRALVRYKFLREATLGLRIEYCLLLIRKRIAGLDSDSLSTSLDHLCKWDFGMLCSHSLDVRLYRIRRVARGSMRERIARAFARSS